MSDSPPISPQAPSSCRARSRAPRAFALLLAAVVAAAAPAARAALWAGAAKVDVTLRTGPVSDPLYVKALVLADGKKFAVIVTVDAVAIGEIGPIGNDYLANVRREVQRELKIDPASLLVNASHCHGLVRPDVDRLTVEAIRSAFNALTPVKVGVGTGREDRVMENRRMKLKSGREADVRHAYSLPPDDQVVSVGPIDPEIGVLRFDRMDGTTVAVLYNYAGHPIQGVPSGGNTADVTGFASQVIEDNLPLGAVALFVQGCGGDINPVHYKDVYLPRDARPLGQQLGLSTLQAVRQIVPQDGATFNVTMEKIAVPRANHTQRIAELEQEREKLTRTLRGTTLNLKTFLSLYTRDGLAGEYPSAYAHHYLSEAQTGRDDFKRLDAENRKQVTAYLQNIHTMEELTRVQTNLALLRRHQQRYDAAGGRSVEAEVVGLRVGSFYLVSFPAELTVQIGLNIKQASPHEHTFVAGYSNGYLYYAPTAEQLKNVGNAQEDSDCLLGPGWQEIFESKASAILNSL